MDIGVKAAIQSALDGLSRRHAIMAPLLLGPITCWSAAYVFSFQESLRAFCPLLVVIGAFTAASVVLVFGWLLVRAPEKLQSESHQIRLKALEILSEQGRTKNLNKLASKTPWLRLFRHCLGKTPEDEPRYNSRITGIISGRREVSFTI